MAPRVLDHSGRRRRSDVRADEDVDTTSSATSIVTRRWLESAIECYVGNFHVLGFTGQTPENLKTLVARLVEAYAEELGIDLVGMGSWTLKRKEVQRGA